MQRIVSCAVETDRILRPLRATGRGGVAIIVSEIIEHTEYPNRSLRENAIRACLGHIRSVVRVEMEAVVEGISRTRVGGPSVGEDVVEYITRAVAAKKLRGKEKQHVINLAKRGVAASEIAEMLDHGTISERLYAQWEGPVFNSNIDGVVESLGRRGINGEALAWAVIAKESLSHILLVKREANRISRMWPGRKADDLVGYGWRGLRLALRSYNPETAWFSTYACPKIRGAIRDGVRSEHHLPKRLNTFVNKAERAKDELGAILGRHPTQAEIAERLDTEIERVRQIATFAAPTSLQAGEEENGIEVAGGEDVEESVISSLRKETIADALSKLPEDEAVAIRLLVMEDISMQEARERTGASSKQLRTRRDRGLAMLREDLATEMLP